MTVSELLTNILPRLEGKPACDIFEAVRRTQTIIVNRLLLRRSNLLADTITLSITTGDDSVTLNPSGGRSYLAPDGEPCIIVDGSRKYLSPWDSAITVGDAARPKYYQRKGRKLLLYSVSDGDYEITLPAFLAPAVAAELDDELPFDGLLDDAYAEAVFQVMLAGTSIVADQAFGALVDSQVDRAIIAAELADEQSLVDSLNNWR